MRKLVIALLVTVSACAPKVVPTPVVAAPKFPEFTQPGLPPAFAGAPVAAYLTRGWAFLQAGDVKTAEREFTTALAAAPSFYPAETSLGYVELARQDANAALPHFDRALERQPDEVSALLGRGEALTILDREEEAAATFEAVLALDPARTELRRRVEVLKFRGAEQGIARARQLARDGHSDEAIQAYAAAISSSPDSPFLYREVAAIERRRGNDEAALADFRKAVGLDPTDAKSLEQIGEILAARNDLEGAARAFNDVLALESNPDAERRLEDVRSRMALARLPAEYRAIDGAAQITRGDLAALIGIRLAPLLQVDRRRDAALITDVRTHWAATWIMAVARAGVMEPFANHAFQPRGVVRRSDLAVAVARLLRAVATQHPTQAKSWDTARLKFTDLPPSHLAYPAASVAVAAGVMTTVADAFQPSRPVSGAETLEAITRLESLAGLRAATKTPK
jgi:tetratricopeptide (TPR) repeat protein